MTAISNNKCRWFDYWEKEDLSISVSISEHEQLKITYESNSLMEIANKEQNNKDIKDI
jgi:hypothetical protein